MAAWDYDNAHPITAGPISPSIRVVLDFIEKNFSQGLSMADLADLSGLSLHRFITVFRCQVGIPPHQYLCRTRVRQARRLLKQGVPAAAVALDTGFCDQSHLSRHFKRQCGVTPGHFTGARRNARPASPNLSSQEAAPCA